MTITHIYSNEASKIRDKLLIAIGTENVSNQWQIFMHTVRKELPLVLSKGRPSKKDIQNSIIGQLGFKSWKEFLTTSVDNNGLGLLWSKWQEWSRAWAFIADNIDYYNSDYTASQINSMYQYCRKSKIDFPASPDVFENTKKLQEEEKQRVKAETQTELKRVNQELKIKLTELTINSEKAKAQNDLLTQQLNESKIEVKKLTTKVANLTTELNSQAKRNKKMSEQNKKLSEQINNYFKMGFIQRLKFAFKLK